MIGAGLTMGKIEIDEGDKISFRELVGKLFAYRDSISSCPTVLTQEILARIDSSYTLLHGNSIIDIGSEGAIVAAIDAGFEKVALKIANTEFNEPGKIQKFLRGFWNVESIDENSFRNRFIKGCQVEKKIYEYIQKENVNYFCVPRINRVSRDPGLFVEMEFLEGIPILRWLKEKKSLKYSMELFLQLLKSVAFYQDYGYVHRDLKTENLMITDGSKIALVDWTMSKAVGERRDLTMPGVKMGTLPYASPKLIIDGESVDANYTDDVFSLGIMLVEFCNMELTPRPKDYKELGRDIDYVVDYLHDLKNYIPEQLRAIFMQATRIDEEDRYQTAQDFYKDFDYTVKRMGLSGSDHTKTIRINRSKEEKPVPQIEEIISRIEKLEKFQKEVGKL